MGGCPQEWRTEVTQLSTASDSLQCVHPTPSPAILFTVSTASRAEVRILLRFTNAGASRRGEDDKGAREPLGQVDPRGLQHHD
jgi:hypothetical protein